MSNSSKDGLFTTRDIGLAKYLFTQGFTPDIISSEGYHLYIFQSSEKLTEHKLLYESGRALVNPMALESAGNRFRRVQREGGVL